VAELKLRSPVPLKDLNNPCVSGQDPRACARLRPLSLSWFYILCSNSSRSIPSSQISKIGTHADIGINKLIGNEGVTREKTVIVNTFVSNVLFNPPVRVFPSLPVQGKARHEKSASGSVRGFSWKCGIIELLDRSRTPSPLGLMPCRLSLSGPGSAAYRLGHRSIHGAQPIKPGEARNRHPTYATPTTALVVLRRRHGPFFTVPGRRPKTPALFLHAHRLSPAGRYRRYICPAPAFLDSLVEDFGIVIALALAGRPRLVGRSPVQKASGCLRPHIVVQEY
jgi:hypothetical protein